MDSAVYMCIDRYAPDYTLFAGGGGYTGITLILGWLVGRTVCPHFAEVFNRSSMIGLVSIAFFRGRFAKQEHIRQGASLFSLCSFSSTVT